jgi:hypothetical protein
MRKTTYFLLVITVFVTVFASACGGSPAPATQAAPPPVNVAPTQPPVQAVAPTQQQAAAAPAQNFAPACQAAVSCSAPEVKDIEAANTFCVEKIPYTNISLAPGTTFEALDPKGELKCKDSGTVVNGKNIITCTGKQLWTYDLKVTNTSCASNSLATGTGQCPDGSGYDTAQNCCAPLTNDGGGSVTIKVNMGACPLPQ